MGAAGSIESVEKLAGSNREMSDISTLENAKAEVVRLRAALADQAEIIATDSILMDELRAAVQQEVEEEAEKLKKKEEEALKAAAAGSVAGAGKAAKTEKGKKKGASKRSKRGKKAKTATQGKTSGSGSAKSSSDNGESDASRYNDIFADKPADASDCTSFVQAKREVVALRRVARLAYAILRARVPAVLLTELPQAIAKVKGNGKTPLVVGESL